MTVISLICQKGGTAKTTTVVNLAVEALAYGLEVVIIDLDLQVSACDRPARASDGALNGLSASLVWRPSRRGPRRGSATWRW
jgi:cellulose biosynthesis protein BcsQ